MPKTVISVENLSKSYRLGQIGTGTLSRDLEIWLAKLRGKPNPYLKIGQTDPSELDGETLWALRDVSFQVQQGEVLGIIGRNGAGKSTLLKILSRVTAPTSGQVKVKGRIASLLEVGTGFHPELTGRENIFLNGAILGMSKQEVQRKFDEIVSFAEVEKFVDTPVKRYSSGMYVRLAFAVAAHLESEILLVDEVLAVGDAEFQKKCLGKMGDVAINEGRTVLFVSHNMMTIQSLCSNSIFFQTGEINYIGSTNDVVNKYLENDINSNEFNLPEKWVHEGNGSIRFTKWKITDPILGEGSKIGTGNNFRIKLFYECKPDVNLINSTVSVTILILDMYSQPLLSGSTYYVNEDFVNIYKRGIFLCEIPKLPLIPGIYKIYLWCSLNRIEADKVKDAGKFEVYPTDFFNSGKLPQKKHGSVLIENHWEIYPI